MERLNVITVPATDLDRGFHTAFTVYDESCEDLRTSVGWTLRDAVDFYAQEYGVRRDEICLARPFKNAGKTPARAWNQYVTVRGWNNMISQAQAPAP